MRFNNVWFTYFQITFYLHLIWALWKGFLLISTEQTKWMKVNLFRIITAKFKIYFRIFSFHLVMSSTKKKYHLDKMIPYCLSLSLFFYFILKCEGGFERFLKKKINNKIGIVEENVDDSTSMSTAAFTYKLRKKNKV